jgi:hypothetical protein
MEKWYSEIENLYGQSSAMSTFKGYGITPIRDCINAAWSSDKFRVKTLEEALRLKDFTSRFREMFARNIGLAKFLAKRKAASDELASTIEHITSEFPKVIVDGSNITFAQKHLDDFKDAGGINLPFPAISLCIFSNTIETLMGANGDRLIKEPSLAKALAAVSIVYLHQDSDGYIHAWFPVAHPSGADHLGIMAIRIEYDKTKRKIDCSLASFKGQKIGFLTTEHAFRSMLSLILYGIHQMTFSDDEVRIAVPTPKEKQVNRKRIRSNKAPLIEFRLIKIAQPKSQLPSLPQGTHASPRQHWRRGHWRNLASGKRVFIKPMLVGDEKNGKIIKDYIVEEPAHAH